MSARDLNLFKAIDFLIRVESGPDAGKAFRIRPPRITIGRDPQTCQIIINDPKCSRQQLQIIFTDEIICKDLSSRKTTLVNGKKPQNPSIKPGDEISFGNTRLRFLTRANAAAQPQIAAPAKTPEVIEKQKGRKQFRLFLMAAAILVGVLLFLESPEETKEQKGLFTQSQLNQQIEESKERTSLIQRSRQEKKQLSDKNYIYNVEKHFISGFRDYQNGVYGRAIESFGTTIATDQQHQRAKRYTRSAQRKRADLIDTHLRDAVKYKEKLMFNRCAAEFEKAIILINDVNSKKYNLAVTQLEECRLLRTGGFQ